MIAEHEARFTRPTKDCPHPEFWHSRDEWATEDEVIVGIFGLVVMCQPQYVVETGSYVGDATLAIGNALKQNGHGELDSIEVLPKVAEVARERVAHLDRVRVHTMNSLEFTPKQPIDLAFFDSGGGLERIEEFNKWYPDHLTDRTIAVFHDTAPHHRHICLAVHELVAEGKLAGVFLPTPRGLFVGRVVK